MSTVTIATSNARVNVTRGPVLYLLKAHGCKASVTLMG